jgi:hypothetical protein
MMNKTQISILLAVVTLLFRASVADDTTIRREKLDAVTGQLTSVEYLLRYKLEQGATLRWQVTHLASTQTTIKGNTQTAKSKSTSVKVWQVKDVEASGNASFVHQVDEVNMWQKVSDRAEVRYNSKTDQEVPPIYKPVAETIGVPMYLATIDPRGQILKRESQHKQTESSQIGLENMTILLPEKPVKVGSNWYAPSQLNIRLPDGIYKEIKIRRLYSLSKVHAGVATIDVKTEVLTPITDAQIKMALLQRLNQGTIKFDIDAGLVLSKQMKWDETIINFNGADSIMHYLAEFTEEFIPSEGATATRPVVKESAR